MPTTNELLFMGNREIAVLGELSRSLRAKPDRAVKRRKRRLKPMAIMGGLGSRLRRFLDLLEEEEDESDCESVLSDVIKDREVDSGLSISASEATYLDSIDDAWAFGGLESDLNYADALSFVSAIVSGAAQEKRTDDSISETCDKGTETDDGFLVNGSRSVTIDCGADCVIEHPVVPPSFAPNSSPRLSSRARRLLVPS
jgi:hypothetical protein